jgi:hypothetical protein
MLQQKFWHFLHGKIGPPNDQSHMKGIFISLFLPCVKGSERGFLSQACYCGCSSHLFRNLHSPCILNWQWSRSLATDKGAWKPLKITFSFHHAISIYKTVFSGILPLKSKIRINVIPSPDFKLEDFKHFQGFQAPVRTLHIDFTWPKL